MKLNDMDGTQKTIDDLKKAYKLLNECLLRIQEINNSSVQFDYVTCQELANCTDKISVIAKKIDKVVYQE